MWFTPVSSRDPKKLLIKVMNIIDVVAAFKDTGQEWFEHLLQNVCITILGSVEGVEISRGATVCLGVCIYHVCHVSFQLLKKESEKGLKHCEKSCEQIINCLVENVLTIEESEVWVGRYIHWWGGVGVITIIFCL